MQCCEWKTPFLEKEPRWLHPSGLSSWTEVELQLTSYQSSVCVDSQIQRGRVEPHWKVTIAELCGWKTQERWSDKWYRFYNSFICIITTFNFPLPKILPLSSELRAARCIAKPLSYFQEIYNFLCAVRSHRKCALPLPNCWRHKSVPPFFYRGELEV